MQNASPAGLARIHTIAVIPALEPEGYSVENIGDYHVHASVLPILIAAGDQHTLPGNGKRLATLIRRHAQTPVTSELATDIAIKLSALSYKAKVEDGTWRPANTSTPIEPGKIKSTADAVLVFQPLLIGFRAKDVNSMYRPVIAGTFTLLGKDRKHVLYRANHACGWGRGSYGPFPASNISATKWAFDDYDQMMSRPRIPAEALSACAAAVAATVTADLDPHATAWPRPLRSQ